MLNWQTRSAWSGSGLGISPLPLPPGWPPGLRSFDRTRDDRSARRFAFAAIESFDGDLEEFEAWHKMGAELRRLRWSGGVVGAPSGAGKSSLLSSGLIPALGQGALPGSRAWPIIVTTPRAEPLSRLAARVAKQTGVDLVAVGADPDRFVACLAPRSPPRARKRGTRLDQRVWC
ncbi:MAG: hypothetical protein ACRDSP_25835 [Pseudonocardiaceae bacterium]